MIALLVGLPDDVSVGGALQVAGAAGRLNTVDFTFDWSQTYTFWSGLLGGLFLMLSYFGCDQSQVQRYLTAKSIDEGRQSLLMSAYFKIPLQALVLLSGVLVFVFYLFNQPPMLFNDKHAKAIAESPRAAEYQQLEAEFAAAFTTRRAASVTFAAAGADEGGAARAAFHAADTAVKDIRARAAALVLEITDDEMYKGRTGDTPAPDVNYVFPTFITTKLPIGIVGLMIAAIFAAAMSSIAAELNSLATSTVIDIYRRHLKPSETDTHYLQVSRLCDGILGTLRLRGRDLCGRPWFAHRSGQPLRILLLRIPARRLRPRAGLQACEWARRFRRPDRGDGCGGSVCLPSIDQWRLVPLA